jgi:LEA14-like dessication related protein
MRRVAVVVGALALATGTGCASVAKAAFKEPVVSLRDVKLVGIGLTGGTLDIVLNVFNPNEFRLDASRLTYEVLADSASFAKGTLEQQFVVQTGDSAQIRLPITFTYAGLGAAANALRNSGAVNYRVKGGVTVATPVGSFTVPYDQTGRFTLLGRNDH